MKTLLSASMSGSSADPHRLGSSRPMSTMSFAHRTSVDAVECPKCGKRSIVERSSNIFDCLNCSFHRELPPVDDHPMLSLSTPSQSMLSRAGSGFSKVSSRQNLRSQSRSSMQQYDRDQREALSSQRGQIMAAPLQRRSAALFTQHPGLSQRNSLDALFSADSRHAALDPFSLEMNEEPDKSQPWVFAAIAVIFGILLL